MRDHPHHGHSFNCSPITCLNRQAVYSTRHLLPSSGRHWFPREIDCPRRVALEPHTIVLWDRMHEIRLIVCTSYTNSSCGTLLYSFIRLFCFHKIAQIVALLIFGIHSFGDTLLPRVHTASQQAHGKLKIDSVRFYTHKFLHGNHLKIGNWSVFVLFGWCFVFGIIMRWEGREISSRLWDY